MQEITSRKAIAKNSVYLYIRMVAVMILSLISVRLIIRSLGVVDYGLYNAIGGVVTAMSFVTSVMVSASQRYFAVGIAKDNIEEQKNTCCSVILSFIVIVIVGALLIESVGLWFVMSKMNIPAERYEACLYVFHLSTFTLLVHLLVTPFHSLVVAHEDMNIYAIVSILDAVLKVVCITILFIGSFDNLILYSFLLVLEALIILVIYFTIAYRKYPELRFRWNLNLEKIKSILSFSGWTLLGSMAGTATNQGTNILLYMFVGPLANAAYAVCNQVGVAINTCGFGFFSAVRPPLMKTVASGDNDRIRSLFYMSSKLLFLLLSFAVIPLYVYIPEILDLWIGVENEYIVSFTKIMIISIFIQCLSNPITTIVQAAGKVKRYHLLVDGFILLSIAPSYYVLKNGFDAHFALVVSLTFFFVGHIIRLNVLNSVTGFSVAEYLRKFMIPVFIILLMAFLIFSNLSNVLQINTILSVLLVGLLNMIFMSVMTYLILLNKKEKNKVRDIIKTRMQ